MHVAIVGAGALGHVYGARLARHGADVTMVVRAPRMADAPRLRFERVEDGDHHDWSPQRATDVPPSADVVIVCVRNEQLDDALVALLRAGPDVPCVFMTPMLPQDFARMRAGLGGERVVAGMPGVVAYVNEHDAVRYWLPRSADTLVEEVKGAPAILPELVRELDAAGIRSHLELGVHELNPATTVSFLPLAFALDVAGSFDALLGDHALLDLALRGKDEGAELAHTIGKVVGWAGLLLKFASPMTLKIGVGIARKTAAEAWRYTEEHFGRKLHAQNLAMAEKMAALADEKGTPHEAIDALVSRLRAR